MGLKHALAAGLLLAAAPVAAEAPDPLLNLSLQNAAAASTAATTAPMVSRLIKDYPAKAAFLLYEPQRRRDGLMDF